MLITKGGVALVLLVIVAVFVIPQAGAANFIVISGLLSLFIVNLPLSLRMVRGMSVRREHATHVKEGSEMQVTLHLANRSRTPKMLIQLTDKGPAGKDAVPLMVPFIGGGEVLEIDYTCKAMTRGIYEFTSCGLESTAPFGLFGARKAVPASSRMVVYPIYYELPGVVLPFTKTYTGLTAAPGSRPGEGLSFFGLREYRQGDPIRKIHWSSTLRARTLMVKEFEEDIHSSVVIMLDTHGGSITAGAATTSLEAAIRAAASIANHTLAAGHPTALARFDDEFDCPRCDKSAGDLTAILDSLAALKPSARKASDLLEEARALVSKRANYIAVLLSKDRAALEALLRARSRGVEAMLVIVDRNGPRLTDNERKWFPGMMDLYEQAGITTVFLTPDDDIQSVLCERLKPVRRLRI